MYRTVEDLLLPTSVLFARAIAEAFAERLCADEPLKPFFDLVAMAETFHWVANNKATILIRQNDSFYRCFGNFDRSTESFEITNYNIVGYDTNLAKEVH